MSKYLSSLLLTLWLLTACKTNEPVPLLPTSKATSASIISTEFDKPIETLPKTPSQSAPPSSTATSIPPTTEPISLQSTFEIYSENVNDFYKIYISLPEGYDPDHPKGYHAIFLLDGDWYFDGSGRKIGHGGVSGIAALLANGKRIPKSIVVGIGYANTNQRGRDFNWRMENFHAFLTDELIPRIDSDYRTNTDAPRTLIEHSSGGYFAFYAFCQFDENGYNPFQQVVAISGDYSKMEWKLFREEGDMSKRIGEDGEVNAALFMAVGGKEENRFISSFHDMVKKVESRTYQGFRFKDKIYQSQDHMGVVNPATWDGLLWVFGE